MPTKKAKTTPKSTKRLTSKPATHAVHAFTWREVALAALVLISASCIGITLAADAAFDPARDAERALERLVDDYYTEFLYPSTLNYNFTDPGSKLAEYTGPGFATLRLRQLLFFKDNDPKAIKPFDNIYYYCDQDDSTIRIFPIAPYGPRDYRIEFNLDCTVLPR